MPTLQLLPPELIGAVAAIAVAVAVELVRNGVVGYLIEPIASRLTGAERKTLAGVWFEVAQPFDLVDARGEPNVDRCDIVKVREFRGQINGTITRVLPIPTRGMVRRWRFVGHFKENAAVLSYWTLTAKVDPDSFGTMVLFRDLKAAHKSREHIWRGFYTRPVGQRAEKLSRRNITWLRTDPRPTAWIPRRRRLFWTHPLPAGLSIAPRWFYTSPSEPNPN